MFGWLTVFLDEHSVSQRRVQCQRCNCSIPDCTEHATFQQYLAYHIDQSLRGVICLYGESIGTHREEEKWPIAEPKRRSNGSAGHLGIYMGKIPRHYFNGFWFWPRCSHCDCEPSCDRLRRVGPYIICYACFDRVRFHVAFLIRETFSRFLLGTMLPPSDIRYAIYGLLYRLMLYGG